MQTLIDPALLAKVVLYVALLNIGLSAFKAALDKIDITDDQKANSKLYQAVAKAVSIVGTVTDWLQGNRAH